MLDSGEQDGLQQPQTKVKIRAIETFFVQLAKQIE